MQDADEQRRGKLAKVLAQTENPTVLKTVDTVLKGLGSIFGSKSSGGGGGKASGTSSDTGQNGKEGK